MSGGAPQGEKNSRYYHLLNGRAVNALQKGKKKRGKEAPSPIDRPERDKLTLALKLSGERGDNYFPGEGKGKKNRFEQMFSVYFPIRGGEKNMLV